MQTRVVGKEGNGNLEGFFTADSTEYADKTDNSPEMKNNIN